MLSRVANNLYWMGRYIERAEHFARYGKQIYFSSLDAPILKTYDRNFVLESMLYMAGIFDMDGKSEKDILFRIGLDTTNTNSIISNVTFARENARGARNAISTELWEAINKYYHLATNYPQKVYLTTGLYDFNQMILDQTSIVSGKIYGTLLHDDEWAIILLGMHIERALQIIRIINSKLHDIYKIEQAGHPVNEMSFEWTTLLRCVESFDMNRKFYMTIPDREQVLEFLMLNPHCPRSIAYSLNGIRRYEAKISQNESQQSNTINFKIGKLYEQYRYLSFDEYKDDIYGLLNYTQEKITEIGAELEKEIPFFLMEEFYIEYFIENKYESTVRKANFQLLVIPDSGTQKVSELKFYCSESQEMHLSNNIFGFKTINYYINNPFTEFWFKLSAKIEKPEINPFYISPLLPTDEYELVHSLDFQIDNSLFLSSTELTKMPALVNFAFPVYSGEIQIFEYLLKLSTFIFQLLEYSPESTDINTPIKEILQLRKGVCQDYAHLFISVCRQNKIPVRYVSGYLNQGVDFIGASQLHAWVEALIPDLGWIGFDATNNLVVDHHYIKIAHGTDYRDCSPIIGVLETTGAQKSIHSVTVTNQ